MHLRARPCTQQLLELKIGAMFGNFSWNSCMFSSNKNMPYPKNISFRDNPVIPKEMGRISMYRGPPCTNYFRSAPFSTENIIFLCYKIRYLIREVNCTEPSPSLRVPWVHIFSHVRPFYERAVSDLDRSMHRSLWV